MDGVLTGPCADLDSRSLAGPLAGLDLELVVGSSVGSFRWWHWAGMGNRVAYSVGEGGFMYQYFASVCS